MKSPDVSRLPVGSERVCTVDDGVQLSWHRGTTGKLSSAAVGTGTHVG